MKHNAPPEPAMAKDQNRRSLNTGRRKGVLLAETPQRLLHQPHSEIRSPHPPNLPSAAGDCRRCPVVEPAGRPARGPPARGPPGTGAGCNHAVVIAFFFLNKITISQGGFEYSPRF
jgi:hypothetical protein